VCDEAQFYTPAQVEQLARVVDDLDVDVHALGLLTDFRGRLFPGSARFLELADERVEVQVEARCWCGARATQNARLVDGRQVYDGDVVVVGDTDREAQVSYELLCRRHWMAGETGRATSIVAALSDAG
jgi:thymidine kinase